MPRRKALTPEKKRLAVELAAEGCSRNAIAKAIGVSAITIRRAAAQDAEFAAQLDQADPSKPPQGRLNPSERVLLKMFVAELRAAFEKCAL